MGLDIEHVDVWAASIKDRPGGVAEVLGALREAGADLDFIISRRAPDRPGEGVVFVAPLRGDAEIDAASLVGFNVASSLHSVRVMGENRAGIAHEVTARIAAAGINLRGFSGAVIGSRYILYLALDSSEDADAAIQALRGL